MIKKKDFRKEITFDELDQMTLDKYYENKSSRHNSAVFKIREILMALIMLGHAVKPSEIVKVIRDRSKRFEKDYRPGADVKSQVKYYLKELVKIEIVEKDCDGYYRLAYKVIPSLPDDDIGFYLKRENPDPSVIVSMLEVIIDYCERLKEYYLGDES
ncbi:MAG: hypothetical protein FP824_06200 [Euryarchaeota archaeon]|nr:hypothetical protein [Euryarchaeota archaeon]MBU4032937.1 hypothetical protein [Candidatus Thermoplasmatota archaeon]MBU4071177.1 hypothetical protein [Candidatus Thermoplasmatota archaeon]MBU4143873.1 hypothetical protein [Candidatus Thermoplasmatota archaeon]